MTRDISTRRRADCVSRRAHGGHVTLGMSSFVVPHRVILAGLAGALSLVYACYRVELAGGSYARRGLVWRLVVDGLDLLDDLTEDPRGDFSRRVRRDDGEGAATSIEHRQDQ